MKRIDMRTTYIAIGTIATLGAALAACSGGGGSSTTPATTAGAAAPNLPSTFGSNNFSGGPTGTMSVTIHIPARTQRASAAVRARIHAAFGAKHADARIRSMANTSPSSLVRTNGKIINTAASAIEEAANRRGVQYVSPDTFYMEVVVTDSTNSQYLVDNVTTCYGDGGGSCTSGNIAVPVGSNYNVSMFLYDDCAYLLSAGTTSGVAVTASASPVPVAITLNPVVAYYDVETTATTPFVADASQAQTFTVSVAPLDADNYYELSPETTPGVLIDYTFTPITGVTLTLKNASDITPSSVQTLSVPTLSNASPTPYLLTSPTYTYSGTGGDSNATWDAAPVTSGSPIVPYVANGPYGYNTTGVSYGKLSVAVLPVQLIWTNPEGFPNPEGSPGYFPPGNPPDGPYAPSPQPSGENYLNIPQFAQFNSNTWALEFPALNNGQGYGYFGVQEIVAPPSSAPYPLTGFTGTISFTDNGYCSGVFSYPAGPLSYASPDPTYGVVLQGNSYNLNSPSPGNGNTPCSITGTDSTGYSRAANLEVFADSSSLTIQSHARRTK